MKRNRITILILLTLLLAGGIAMLLGSSATSRTERRALAQWPSLRWADIRNGSFMSKAERAAADQFPLRETFRRIKALFRHYVLLQPDSQEIYLDSGSAIHLESVTNDAAIARNASRLAWVQEQYLQNTDVTCYYAVIPDKGYYRTKTDYPALDYSKLLQSWSLPMTYLDLFPALNLESYYRSDPHWRQEALEPVVQALSEGMDFSYQWDYQVLEANRRFCGAYAGQSQLPIEPDTLRYLENDTLRGCRVWSLEHGDDQPVYDSAQLTSLDPYSFYLSGPIALQVIENPRAETDRELILFRDSFGSSLAPLLASSYAKVTLVDLRYIHPEQLGDYIAFTDQDVLFLFSCTVINQVGIFR